MAVLKASTIEGNLDVGDGIAGAITCNGAMSTKGDLIVGDGVTAALKANGDFATSGALTIAGGNPSQYRICRQQSITSGLVEWIDFAVYDTNGTTRLF
ncbi:MAG: hypothetical protein CXT73_00180 [Methanobacteriota archaeon]|jgi:hypothetical protein|nr:MAG: hypothetical protein CXT73_00180 [Euryarchaeota archaeon]